MSDYTQTTTFATKDALASGDPNKIVLGAEVDTELSAISTAITSKQDTSTLFADLPPNSVYFRANRASTQAIADNTFTKVAYSTEVTDEGGDYATTGIFTAPADGYYLFTCAAEFEAATDLVAGDQIILRFATTPGNFEVFRGRLVTTNSRIAISGSLLIKLSSTNTVEVDIYQNSGVNQNISGNATNNWFSGARIA